MVSAEAKKAPGVPPGVREQIAMLREVYMHGAPVQDWLAAWWARVGIEDRRLLLALVGLDESEESARRQWAQLLVADRDRLVIELRRIGRIIEALRWAT